MHGLILDSLLPDIRMEVDAARRDGCELTLWSGDPDELPMADIVLHVRTRVDGPMIRHLTSCRAIGRFGTGLDTVDLEVARTRGVAVVGVPDYATDEVAQHAVMLALAVGRGVARFGGVHPSGAWSKLVEGPPLGLVGPVGIIGFGPIGNRASQLFRGLGFEVLVATRRPTTFDEDRITVCSLDELLDRSEVVSLHTAFVPETRHLIDAKRLRQMRDDAILVNTGRGGLVDSGSLLAALRGGWIRGAGLDVFETSDQIDWWDALRAPELNVVVTPHVAWYSPRSISRLREDAVRRTIAAARTVDDPDPGSR